jgi:hypothetical protein
MILTANEIEILVATGLRAELVGARDALQQRLGDIGLPTLKDDAPQLRADLACLNQRDLPGDPHPLVAYLEGAIDVGEAAEYAKFAGLVRSRLDGAGTDTHDDLDELDVDSLETQKDFAAIRDFDELDVPDGE